MQGYFSDGDVALMAVFDDVGFRHSQLCGTYAIDSSALIRVACRAQGQCHKIVNMTYCQIAQASVHRRALLEQT